MKRQPDFKTGKGFKETFLQRRYTVGNKRMKRCSTLLVVREIQIKTTYHLTPITMAGVKKTSENNCWGGCGEMGTLLRSIGGGNIE